MKTFLGVIAVYVLAALLVLGLVSACDEQPILHVSGPTPIMYHDTERHATCWELSDGSGVAISCLPDKDLAEAKP